MQNDNESQPQGKKNKTSHGGNEGAEAQRQEQSLICQMMALLCWALGVTGHIVQ